MAKKSSTSQMYKNWLIWIVLISLIAYFFTRGDKQNTVRSTAADDLQSKLGHYMSQLDSGHITGNMLKHTLDEDDKGKIYDRVPIDKLKAGSSLIFGSATSKTDEIALTILDNLNAEIQYIRRIAENGDTNKIKETIETGLYQIQSYEGSQVLTDNDIFTPFGPAIVLINMKYGLDKGYKNLSKKFFISKSKHRDGSTPTTIRIYPWMDPVNYPKNKQAFSYESSYEISGMNSKQ
jgi:hypothetical protein